jgi:hypothetical protein
MTGGKPNAIRLQSMSVGDAVNPLVAFYDIHGIKRDVLFSFSVPGTTRNTLNTCSSILVLILLK